MLTRILRALWSKRRQHTLNKLTDAERDRLSALVRERLNTSEGYPINQGRK